jgi:PAS domain-containing protein
MSSIPPTSSTDSTAVLATPPTSFMERLIGASTQSLIVAEAVGTTIVYVNQAFEKLTGFCIIRSTWADHEFAPGRIHRLQILVGGVELAIQEKRACRWVALMKRRDGSQLHADIDLFPLLEPEWHPDVLGDDIRGRDSARRIGRSTCTQRDATPAAGRDDSRLGDCSPARHRPISLRFPLCPFHSRL